MSGRSLASKVILLFRYPGGKYYALKNLQLFWEANKYDEYREPFLGGGAVFWAKPKVKYNWLNDIDKELIFTLDFITNKKNRKKLIALFDREKEPNKNLHARVKNMKPKNDLERAYKYYYLNRTSFSGKMKNPTWGYRPKRSLPPHRWKERVIPCGEKLRNVKLTAVDFTEVILAPKTGKAVLIFLDPPYYRSRQESHFVYSFTKYDHIRLCSLLKRTPYHFFLTYDDCPEVRKSYKWAHIYEIRFFYRLDNSRDRNNKRKVGNELVITNYRVERKNSAKQLTLSFSHIKKEETKVRTKSLKPKMKKPITENIRSPIRFPGSKYQAIRFIAPFWDCVDHDEYREPFLGSGAVFFVKPLAKINWLNDIDRELILTFRCMANEKKREILKRKVVKVNPTREYFYKLRNSTPKKEIDIIFRYFVINRTAYSGIMNKPNWGYHPKKSVPPQKWSSRIELAGLKLEHAEITNFDYKTVISAPATGESVFMFIDPPYFKTDQKRAYFHSFKLEDHLELAKLLKNTKFKFCLTYDDCSEVKDLYSWANIHEYSWRYHTANANRAVRKMGKELIITN